MNFVFFDLSLLIAFTIFIIIFLYTHKKNMRREGIFFLYRTQLGVKIIKIFSEKNKKILNWMKYPIIISCFCLMISIFWFFVYSFWQYLINPRITELVKAPPIAPLIPYFPKLFGMESFFPPLYFIYFIIVISLVAIIHEFSHGIFMHLYKIKIKSTGFVFLGPILGAFVEQDDKQMKLKKASKQMTILSAGTFANLILCFVSFIIMALFFISFFVPSGYIFNTYSITQVNKSEIQNISLIGNLTEVKTALKSYYLDSNLIKQLNSTEFQNYTYLVAYEGPAVLVGLNGAITEINGEKIISQKQLANFLSKTSSGEKVKIITENEDGEKTWELILDKNPNNNSIGYIGIGSYSSSSKGIVTKVVYSLTKFKDPNIYYKSKYSNGLTKFVYDFLWWMVMINLLVALFNMLPLAFLDGGRFFYLAIFSLTKSEKIAQKSFKLITYFLFLILILMMISWFFRII